MNTSEKRLCNIEESHGARALNKDVSTTARGYENDVTDDEFMMVDDASSLCHTLEYIMCVPEMCDVVFFVGKKMEPVYGLKAVLSARSSVLYKTLQFFQEKSSRKAQSANRSGKMLRFFPFRNKQRNFPKPKPGHQSAPEKIVVPVSSYSISVFRKFNAFLHLGHVTLTDDTVIGLLCAASDFAVEDLADACWTFLQKSSSAGDVSSIIRPARRYRFHPYYSTIQAKMQTTSLSRRQSQLDSR